MKYFDLHCDTLSACLDTGQAMEENQLQLDLKRLSRMKTAKQVFAVFVHDRYRGEAARMRYQEILRIYNTTRFPSHVTPVLSVENGAALGGSIDAVDECYRDGVRLMTLTWNGANELGGGADTEQGLTSFGREVLARMEALGMVADVSHLSDEAFWDTARAASRPFVATHSNARATCRHRRNLTDQQIRTVFESGGIIGLNLYTPFLTAEHDPDYEDLYRHIARFLLLGGEHQIAWGTDFDGANLCPLWDSVAKMPHLYQKISAAFGKSIADGIFFENANNFFDKNGLFV